MKDLSEWQWVKSSHYAGISRDYKQKSLRCQVAFSEIEGMTVFDLVFIPSTVAGIKGGWRMKANNLAL